MHPYYRETYGYAPEDLPMAARLYPELVSLPLYPDLKEGDAAQVCDVVSSIVERSLNPSTATSA
jgi:perosamine synthetase